MNFDNTYIIVAGVKLYEPMILLTNFLLFFLSIYFFKRLRKYPSSYGSNMSGFMLMLGLSSAFGALAHAAHYEWGMVFYQIVFFMMNATSFVSIYYCFRATLEYTRPQGKTRDLLIRIVLVYFAALLVLCLLINSFLLIKIHAGLVLIYTLAAHLWALKNRTEKGNGLVVTGFVVSFLPLLVHSLKISLHTYFNYKDISHVIMIIALMIIYAGVLKNTRELSGSKA